MTKKNEALVHRIVNALVDEDRERTETAWARRSVHGFHGLHGLSDRISAGNGLALGCVDGGVDSTGNAMKKVKVKGEGEEKKVRG